MTTPDPTKRHKLPKDLTQLALDWYHQREQQQEPHHYMHGEHARMERALLAVMRKLKGEM